MLMKIILNISTKTGATDIVLGILLTYLAQFLSLELCMLGLGSRNRRVHNNPADIIM